MGSIDEPIAHSANRDGHRQPLMEHLRAVARDTATFASIFGAADLGRVAGLWHDLGKFAPAFQQYIRASERGEKTVRGPSHKAAGACMASRPGGPQLAALPIVGHHGGLVSLNPGLGDYLTRHCDESHVEEALAEARRWFPEALEPVGPALPAWLPDQPLPVELFIRMLFSSLVDADFLDTELHFSAGRAEARGGGPALSDLWQQLEADQHRFDAGEPTPVNRVRAEVYQACLAAASAPPGFFRLTVPTGGGKTRSGLAFALRHAIAHDLRRVIVAIPYTSITEQTAAEYRRIFQHPRAVLEHHSMARVDDRDEGEGLVWSRLAAENWDAPVVVTTTVQLFESLLGNRTSACRKLHNIAGSVIILDEVQTLPATLLDPVLDVLRELVAHYRVSVVLCTATQPSLERRSGFPGIEGTREIVPEPERHFAALRRVDYDLHLDEPWPWERVADAMRATPQCLAVVNARADALSLFRTLDDPDALHLSALLCGAHRRDILVEIRQRLSAGEPCRVVATQVVEAGVDLDFPVVLRAVGPLDRIVQAAGRCNREGRLAAGRVIVFRPETGKMPPGVYRTATETTAALLQTANVDLHNPAIYAEFFRRFYGGVNLDAKRVQDARRGFNYPLVADRFRLISDDTVPVVVPYQARDGGRAEPIVDALLQRRGNPRELWRRLQPFMATVRRFDVGRYAREGLLTEAQEGLWIWHGGYDDRLGLVDAGIDPSDLVI